MVYRRQMIRCCLNFCEKYNLRWRPLGGLRKKLAPSVFVALRRDKSLRWAQGGVATVVYWHFSVHSCCVLAADENFFIKINWIWYIGGR